MFANIVCLPQNRGMSGEAPCLCNIIREEQLRTHLAPLHSGERIRGTQGLIPASRIMCRVPGIHAGGSEFTNGPFIFLALKQPFGQLCWLERVAARSSGYRDLPRSALPMRRAALGEEKRAMLRVDMGLTAYLGDWSLPFLKSSS